MASGNCETLRGGVVGLPLGSAAPLQDKWQGGCAAPSWQGGLGRSMSGHAGSGATGLLPGVSAPTSVNDIQAASEMLRKLSGGQKPAEEDRSRQKTIDKVSWKELELFTEKLDAAHIRITSLDLSCMEGGEEHQPLAGGHEEEGVKYNLELNTMDNSSGESVSQNSLPPTEDAPEVAYSFCLPSHDPVLDYVQAHEAPSLAGPCGGAASRPPTAPPHDVGLAPAEPGKPAPSAAPPVAVQPQAGALHSAPGSRPSSAESGSELGLVKATSSTSGSCKSTSSRGGGGGSGPRGGDILTLPLHVDIMGAQGCHGAPARTTSGGWATKQPGGAGVPAVGNAHGPARVQEPVRTSRDMFERQDRPIRYSSLVLPGAVPRESRAAGVKKYIQAVRTKCGELFTTGRRSASKAGQ